MTTPRRLRSVPATVVPPRYPERPDWAYTTQHNRDRYIAAIATLRAGRGWLLDRPATRLTERK